MTLTRARIIQYVGILLALGLVAAGYWYFNVRAGVKTNTTAGGSNVGDGGLGAGLVGYWKLDENTGTSAADTSVNAITALTLTNGPTWTTGQVRSAVDFDGTDDYATTADTATLDFGDTEDITITGWFNRTTSFNTIDTVVAKRNSNTAADAGYIINIDSTTDLIALEISDGTDEYSVTATTVFNSAGWHHFAFVWDQDSATNVEVYIDGRDDNGTKSGTIGNIGDMSNAVAFRLGAESDAGNPFDGLIDEVRVYDRALSPSEITDLYKLTVPTAVDAGLVGYWGFGSDDIRGTLVSDRSGARNTGTLVNTPTKTIGKIGQAFNFVSASTQYINAGSNAIVDDIVNLSTCAWVKPNSSLTAYGDVVTKYTNAGIGWQMLLDYATSSALVPSFYRVFTTTAGWWFAVAVLPYNQWSHICITYNNSSTTNDPVFYVNGVLVVTYETQAPVGTASAEGTGDMYIGAYNNAGSPGEMFDGVIDEPRVYNRIITASEVKALYDAGSANKTNTSATQPEGVGNPDSGLVGYWKLDENTGTSAADSSVNAIAAGTLTNGPTWVTGQIGSGVDFDGTNDYITVADNSLFDFGDTDDFTITGWFNRDTFTSVEEMIVKYDGTNPGYHVFVTDSAGGSTLQAQIFDGTDTYSLSGTTAFTGAGWHHFSVVWDQDSAANTELYVDGRPEGATDSGTIGNIGTLANSIALTFGDRPGYGQPHDGKLDEIRIYDRALSADEIANLARLASPTGVDTGLRGYWSFNAPDTPSTTAYDRSGRRNTGTLTNGPTKVIGRIGQALNFDDTNDYVNIADNAVLDFDDSGNFTITGWFNRETFTTNDTIVAKKNGILASDVGYLAYVAASDDKIHVYLADGTDSYDIVSNTTFTSAGWNHFAIVWDQSSAANTEIYVNGVDDDGGDTGTIANINDLSNALDLRIGTESDGGQAFDGSLDEIRVYNRVLSSAEIKSQYDLGAPDKSNTSISTPQGTGRLDSGLVGYWALDENTGTSAADGSTNGATGTLTNGPTWTTGRIGYGLSFDGTNDYVTMGDIAAAEGGTQVTVAAWIKQNGSTNERHILDKGGCLGNGTNSWELFTASGEVTFFIPNGVQNATTSGANISDNQWHHVLGTYNGAQIRVYVDGKLRGSTPHAVTLGSDTSAVEIGGNCNGGGSCGGSCYWNGQVDEARVYDRVLSDEEILQLYQLGGTTGGDTGLKGYWSFNGPDVSGTTAYDRSGGGSDGTLTNGPTKVIGKLGQALNFDGTDDYVNAGSAAIIDNLTNMSVCLWVNPDTIPSGYTTFFSQMDNGAAEVTFGFHDNGTADYVELYRSFSTTFGEWHTDGNIIPTGAWSHICFTYNNSSVANDPAFYLNGAQIGISAEVSTPVGTASSTAGGDYYIGALDNGGAGSEFFDGKLDEVRLYNRILTAAEIQSLYNSGR